jgi:hypothetical protein
MVPFNIKKNLMFDTWKILDICFIYPILNFTIVFLFSTYMVAFIKHMNIHKNKG